MIAQPMLEIAEWPAASDVARRLEVSPVYVRRLIEAGRLDAVRTRLGWLIDPSSVTAFETQRAARKAVEAC